MAVTQLRTGAFAPALLFAGAATLGAGGLLWMRHGGAVFQEIVLSGLSLCL